MPVLFGLLLSSCGGQDKGTDRLVASLAGCIETEEESRPNFGTCLLEQFVRNHASRTMPNDPIFASRRDTIVNMGYDASERRTILLKEKADLYKNAKIEMSKTLAINGLEKKFALHDVFYSARLKTDAATQSAIARMKDYNLKAKGKDKYYLEAFDDLMKLWIEDPDIFSPEFMEVLADHFYDQNLFPDDRYATSKNGEHRVEFMFKSRRLIRLEREWGILPHEALSRAYKYAGDPKKGQSIEDIFGGTTKGKLQAYLEPVKSGKRLLGALDIETLKSMNFTTRDLLPILRYQMEDGSDPRMIFQNLAYAIHHGGVYVDGGNDSDDALRYAYQRGDVAAIKKFADLLIGMPVPLENDVAKSIIRSNMLRNDLAVSRYLSADQDSVRVKKFGEKWRLFIRPGASGGKYPNWSGGSISDYIQLAYLAEDYEGANQYLQYLVSTAQAKKQDVSKLHLRAALNTATTIEKLNARVDALKDLNISTKQAKGFYTKCQKWSLYEEDEKFKSCIRKLEWKPSSSAEDQRYVISNILGAARTQYSKGQLEKGRALFTLGLERAAACKCQRDPSPETLGRLIAQDVTLSNQLSLELK